ncbi:MAG TPA: AI-2E family transporter [Acetobacteraceae bacterium]|nr:AI-2E family transporter [Acetobacteraceae bacterium]
MSDLPLPSDRTPIQVQPADTPGLQGLLTLAVAVVVVAGLYLGREVMIPIILAVLLSFLLAPLVNLLRRMHLGRVPSALLAVVLSLGVVLAFGAVIGTQLADLAPDAPRYASAVQQKVDTVQHVMLGRLTTIVRRLGHQLDGADTAKTSESGPTTPDASAANEQKVIPVEMHEPEPSTVQLAQRIIAPIVAPLLSAAIVFVVSIFVLLQREDLRDRLIRLFGTRDLHRTTVAMNDAARRLSNYFLTQLAINATFGVIVGTGLFFIGVPSPVLWAVLGMLLRFVPYIGAPLAAGVPLALAAAVDPGWSMVLWTAALFAVGETIMGQVVEPLLYGRSTGLSPLSVVLAAAFWTWLWGPVGLILSTPLTLCLVVLGRHVERLEFLDILLGDRPPLTPVESFYQRILAGDPDEARAQAELMLKDRSLSSYYDEVALKGLQLAAADSARGVLTDSRIDRVRESISGLIEELDEYADRDPSAAESEQATVAPTRAEQDIPARPAPKDAAPGQSLLPPGWRGPAPVMCLAGRGPFDGAASLMLAQLLRKHGLGASCVPYEAGSRGAIGALDTRGVAMVCISYLELTGSPSHLRYLLRRLRQRMPEALIVVGYWPAEEEILRDARIRAAIGADYYTSSLQDTVEVCVAAACKSLGEAAISA